jgi:hypothetical protein
MRIKRFNEINENKNNLTDLKMTPTEKVSVDVVYPDKEFVIILEDETVFSFSTEFPLNIKNYRNLDGFKESKYPSFEPGKSIHDFENDYEDFFELNSLNYRELVNFLLDNNLNKHLDILDIYISKV